MVALFVVIINLLYLSIWAILVRLCFCFDPLLYVCQFLLHFHLRFTSKKVSKTPNLLGFLSHLIKSIDACSVYLFLHSYLSNLCVCFLFLSPSLSFQSLIAAASRRFLLRWVFFSALTRSADQMSNPLLIPGMATLSNRKYKYNERSEKPKHQNFFGLVIFEFIH